MMFLSKKYCFYGNVKLYCLKDSFDIIKDNNKWYRKYWVNHTQRCYCKTTY